MFANRHAAARNMQVQEFTMFKTDKNRKHAAAAICAAMFASTCLLSAIGPVRAAEAHPGAADHVMLARSTAAMPMA